MRNTLWLLILCCFSFILSAQKVPSKVPGLLEKGDYAKAIEILNGLSSIKDNENALHARAIAYYHSAYYQESLADIARSKSLGNSNNDLNFYLANIYHRQGRYKKAINWYKEYLKGKQSKDRSEKDVVLLLDQSFYALNTKRDIEALVEHLPEEINTKHDEINIVRSPLFPSTIYFNRQSSVGSVLRSYALSSEGWQDKAQILQKISAKNYPHLLDISQDGQIVFIEAKLDKKATVLYKKSGDQKNIYKSAMPYFPDLGDKDLCVVDHKTIIFSSLRPGGQGGYDLFKSIYKGGTWSRPQNLGPQVNGAYDDVSPFMTEDQNLLFFSSNRRESLGGYDVFYSKREKQEWSKAKNMGQSINSPCDEFDFNLEADGISSSFVSDRSGSNGGLDIYFAYFKEKWETQIQPLNKLSFISYEINDVPTEDENQTEPQKEMAQQTNEKEVKKVEPTKERVTPKETNPPIKKETVPSKETEVKPTVVEKEAPKPEPTKEVTEVLKQEKSIEKETKIDPNFSDDLLTIEPLFYENEKEILTVVNKAKLEKLVKLLKIFPEAKVELSNFIAEGPRRDFELYFGVVWMDEIVSYLSEQKIAKDRIILNTLGATFPYILANTGGTEAKKFEKKNQRVDILLYGIPEERQVKYQGFSEVRDSYKDRKYGIYRTIKDDVHFRVKIIETNRIYKHAILTEYNDVMVTKDAKNKNMLYTLGFFESYKEAQSLKEKLINKGFKDAEILAYRGSMMQNKSNIKKLAETNRDIKEYLDKEL